MTGSRALVLVFLAGLAGSALSVGDVSIGPRPSALYVFDIVNDWELTWAESFYWLSDLAYDPGTGLLWTSTHYGDSLAYFPASDPGMLLGWQDLPDGLIDYPRGIALYGTGAGQYKYVTDANFADEYFCYYDGEWITYQDDPAGSQGQGLAVDEEGYLWEASYSGSVYRFTPGGHISWEFEVEGSSYYPKGITLFTHEGNTMVAVSFYFDNEVEFYYFSEPDSWVYDGSASVPYAMDYCEGLEYIPDRGSFYMLVKASGTHHMLEMYTDLLGLQPETWGGIKAAF